METPNSMSSKNFFIIIIFMFIMNIIIIKVIIVNIIIMTIIKIIISDICDIKKNLQQF